MGLEFGRGLGSKPASARAFPWWHLAFEFIFSFFFFPLVPGQASKGVTPPLVLHVGLHLTRPNAVPSLKFAILNYPLPLSNNQKKITYDPGGGQYLD